VAKKIDIDKLAEYKKGLDGTKEAQDKYNKALEQYAEQMKELNQKKEESTILDVRLAQSQAELAEMFGDSLSAYEANNKALEIAQELYDASIDSTKQLTEAQREQIEANYGNEDALKAEIQVMKAKKKAVDDLGPAYKKALQTSKPFFEDTATKLGLLSKKGNKFAKSMGSMFKMAGEEGGLKGLAKGFTEIINPLNIGISIITKVAEATIEMMFAVDKAGASFTKTTGFARKFDGLIADTHESMRKFGVSADDAQKGIVSLRQNLSQFDTLGKATQQRLTNIVTGLEKIGVSADEGAGMIGSLNKTFGITVDQAADMTRELALSGDVLGKTSSKMLTDYNSTLKTLAVYGTKSVSIFKNIATMASSAGVEVDSLMGIANKFDTFADSAKTAAKMNAILGTSFSGNNLMMMDHDQRIKQVIKGIQATGVSFGKLDKFTQQAIAAQLGIKNLDEAQKILSMNSREYDRMKDKQAATAKEQEDLNKRMKAGVDIMTEIKLIMADFAVNMKDFLPVIREMVMSFGEWIKDITPMGLLIDGIALSLAGLAWNTMGMIAKIKLVSKFGGKAIVSVSKSIAQGLQIVAASAKGTSPAIGTLSISLGGIALVIATVAGSVALISYSLAYLFETMIQGIVTLKKVGAGFGDVGLGILAMAGAVGTMTLAVWALAAAAKTLEKSPFGLVLGGLLAGIMSATLGVTMLTTSTDGKAKPKMDMDELTKSAEKIDDLATKLQDLRDNKEALQETFASIGAGLQEAKTHLTADIQATLANLAVMTTGHAAGEMTSYTSAMAVGAMIGTLGAPIQALADGMKGESGKTISLQLDGKATTDFFDGRVAICQQKG